MSIEMLDEVTINELTDVAVRASDAAGVIMKDNLRVGHRVEKKGEIDLVTEVDHLCERTIISILRRAFPEHDILTEEQDIEQRGSEYRWFIDPVDGTTNYVHGLDWVNVTLALEFSDQIIIGVVYDPFRQRRYTAIKGRGAYCNGRRLRVSDTGRMIDSLIATGFPYRRTMMRRNNLHYHDRIIMHCQDIRRFGSAALDMCMLADGCFDAYWELGLNPWDMAAGSLIITEAGGSISKLDGTGWDVYGGEMLASNSLLHQQMVDIIREVDKEQDF